MVLLFFKKLIIKKSKYNKKTKGLKVKMKDQRNFKLFGDQGIEGKKTKFFTRSHPQEKKRGKKKGKKKLFKKTRSHTRKP